jgi:hypothetical protein
MKNPLSMSEPPDTPVKTMADMFTDTRAGSVVWMKSFTAWEWATPSVRSLKGMGK